MRAEPVRGEAGGVRGIIAPAPDRSLRWLCRAPGCTTVLMEGESNGYPV
jgi:hypothetical protein